jgi:hypothetical protein
MVVSIMPSVVTAEPVAAPRIGVTRGDGRVVISLSADSLAVTQTLTARSFDLRVVFPGDAARITGDADGKIRVERGRRSMSFELRSATPDDAERVRAMLGDSLALTHFDRLMASGWAASRREAQVFVGTHAILGLLRGDMAPTSALVERASLDAQPRLITVQGGLSASECWRSYERDMVYYVWELRACIDEASNSYNPLATAFCGYTFDLKATLAFFWLLDCHGL